VGAFLPSSVGDGQALGHGEAMPPRLGHGEAMPPRLGHREAMPPTRGHVEAIFPPAAGGRAPCSWCCE
jgi:hypothetical protein